MNLLRSILLALVVAAGPVLGADRMTVSHGPVVVTPMVTGLDEPWGLAFLPGGGMLITERGGRLLLIGADGAATPVAGVPAVALTGQGGLLDVVVARDFARSRLIYLTFAQARQGGAATAVAVARLDVGSDAGVARLDDVRVIFAMNRASGRGQHFGARIVEARDGTLFVTLGDRGARDQAQNPGAHNGKVLRIARDGTVPADNPFTDGRALPEIWSLGHRNVQGAALDAQGTLWTVEHGARGGDEINRPVAGRNYGWPVISYGREYGGGRIGEGTEKAGLEQPEFYWDPSIAPSGMMIHSGRLFPDWGGDIFVGSLKFDMISRLTPGDDGALREAERLFEGRYPRIRDIREAPDGSIWFLSVGDGAAYRITPG